MGTRASSENGKSHIPLKRQGENGPHPRCGMSISHMDACMHKEHMSCEHFIGSKIRKRRRVGKLGDAIGISKR